MTFTQVMLYPFSLVYGAVMGIRNQLYDRQIFKTTHFPLPVINMGNLRVGGTGKTPHVEYVLQLLAGKKVAVLSRGYKRQTKGFVIADKHASAASLGDEPFQYYQDLPEVMVAVSENRAAGIQNLLNLKPQLDAIVLDDAFQHRGVSPSLNILLSDFYQLFFKDKVLPSGRLREFPDGAARADIVIITKCPEKISEKEIVNIISEVKKAAYKNLPVFFTHYKYGTPVACGQHILQTEKILLITAIANPLPLKSYLQQQGFTILRHYQFPDHHAYTYKDIQKIYLDWQRYSENKNIVIFTTRKDATKLLQPTFTPIWQEVSLFIIPVKVAFNQQQQEFNSIILNHVAGKTKSENT